MRGLAIGFSGSMTTVSTFVVELSTLAAQSPKHAVAYLAVTILLGQAVMLLFLGLNSAF